MLKIKTFILGPLSTNCYLIFNSKQAIVIDPGSEPETILNFLNKHNLKVEAILNTHLHFDHIQGNADLHAQTKAPILASPKDKYLLQTELGLGGFMDFAETKPFEFQPLEPGKTNFLDTECEVLSTPGHSPGSLSFYFPELQAVFVGDVIFYRSIGRTDFPGGDLNLLKQSIEEKIFTLPPETTIYPGHGEPTVVKEEKMHNPFFAPYRL